MSNINDVRFIEFPCHDDGRGHLTVVEGGADVPFEIKRIFYIYGTDVGAVRGSHANSKTEFVFINVSGTSKVKVIDRDGNERVYLLDKPRTGLYLPKMIWKDMYDFSPESVLLVLASEHYDGSEYIRDFNNFLKEPPVYE